MCPRADLIRAYSDQPDSRGAVLKALRERIREDGAPTDRAVQKAAKRGIACHDWWMYVGASAVDVEHPPPGYEDDDALLDRWPTLPGRPTPQQRDEACRLEKLTRRAIGDPRFDYLEHFKVGANGEWVRGEYREGGAADAYATS
jgi:hypothetical protein